MDYELSGRRALITGSNSGIGIGVAKVLAAEGASVIIHGRNAERAEAVALELSATGASAKAVTGDLLTGAGAADAAKAAEDAFGGVDILFNNAGGRTDASAPVDWWDVDPDSWTDTYNLNVTSAVRMIHHFARPMAERGWGRIIQSSSFSAQASSGNTPEYSAVKLALNNVTLTLGKKLAGTGVTVNTIAPGMILTGALEQWLESIAAKQNLSGIEEAKEWALANTLKQTVPRIGTPEDIGYVVAFLSSPGASLISGANIRVDGGASPSVN